MTNNMNFEKKNEFKQQPSPAEYLSHEREEMPSWLENCTADKPICIRDLLKSRIVYNPGAGTEGSPIKIFNTAHAAHVFIYVDYGYTKDKINEALSDDAFHGYHIIREQEVSSKELSPNIPIYHLTDDEKNDISQRYRHFNISRHNAFAILKIYERNLEFSDDHGAKRFAILYLGADAIAIYDVLFGNTETTPFASVVDTYGFGGSYDSFAKGSFIERIAKRTNRLPKYLLCAHHCGCWDGYQMLKNVGGSGHRFLWKRK